MAESVDYSVSSDEEERQGLSVAPVVGWQSTIPTSRPQEEGREEQPLEKKTTATLVQHNEAAMSQVKEPEEEEPRQPLTVPVPSVVSTHTHLAAHLCHQSCTA